MISILLPQLLLSELSVPPFILEKQAAVPWHYLVNNTSLCAAAWGTEANTDFLPYNSPTNTTFYTLATTIQLFTACQNRYQP